MGTRSLSICIWKRNPFVSQLQNQRIQTHICITKGIYNRLPLIMSYLLDIDLAQWSLLLPWKVKFNKSWNTFFVTEICLYIHNIIQPLLLFNVTFIIFWFYLNLMVTLLKLRYWMKKESRELDSNQWSLSYQNDTPVSTLEWISNHQCNNW